MSDRKDPLNGFAATKLPWIIGVAMLAMYLGTLHSWVSLSSLPVVAEIAGWDVLSPTTSPLYFLLTLPFRVLPSGWLPLVLNVFSACCAGITLCLLTRSVALLPHDRTREQRLREPSDHSLLSLPSAWVPPLFAALVCGLQLSFWEHATAASGEMLNLLLFAWVIRCLLEYRINHKEMWLYRAALVYGLSIPNNWAMIGFLPLFASALVWICGPRLFNTPMLLRCLGLGMAGLLLYLLLPLAAILNAEAGASFWEVFRANFGLQKSFLLNLFSQRLWILVMATTSVLPLLLVAIRWPAGFGDMNAFAAGLTVTLFRLVHLLFLAACVWVAFDHLFSPRKLGFSYPKFQPGEEGAPFLTFYYLGAISVGYFTGYFLLILGREPSRRWHHTTPFFRAVGKTCNVGIQAAAAIAVVALLALNWPTIWSHNKNGALQKYSEWLAESLPNTTAVVFSDDKQQPLLAKAALADNVAMNNHVFVDTYRLGDPDYQQILSELYGERWPAIREEAVVGNYIDDIHLIAQADDLVKNGRLYYLHFSFGYFFERLYPKPTGSVFQMLLYPKDQETLDRPALNPDEMVRIEGIAERLQNEFLPLVKNGPDLDKSGFPDTAYVARWLSRKINTMGLVLQRNEKKQSAQRFFSLACQLYDGQKFSVGQMTYEGNLTSQANLKFSRQRLVKEITSADFKIDKNLDKKLNTFLSDSARMEMTLRTFGPFEDPRLCLLYGRYLLETGLYRQAVQEITRATELDPKYADPYFMIAQFYLDGGRLVETHQLLVTIKQIHAEASLSTRQLISLARLEADLRLAEKGFDEAEELLIQGMAPYLDERLALNNLIDFYYRNSQLESIPPLLDGWLSRHANDLNALFDKGRILIELERFKEASKVYQAILENDSDNKAAKSQSAYIYASRGEHDQALEIVNQILADNPEDFGSLFQKATILMEAGRLDQAIETFTLILDQTPTNVSALANRGAIHLQKEQFALAREDFEELKALLAGDRLPHYRLAQVAKKEDDYKAELKHYKNYLKLAVSASSNEVEAVRARVKELEAQAN